MDDYGCYTGKANDYEDLASRLHDHKSVVFSFAPGDCTAYIICLTLCPKSLGVLPFGGRYLERSCVVSIIDRYSFRVELDGSACYEDLSILHHGDQFKALLSGISEKYNELCKEYFCVVRSD